MKYMLMMNTPGGAYQIASWPAEDIKAHIALSTTTRSERAANRVTPAPDRLAPKE